MMSGFVQTSEQLTRTDSLFPGKVSIPIQHRQGHLLGTLYASTARSRKRGENFCSISKNGHREKLVMGRLTEEFVFSPHAALFH